MLGGNSIDIRGFCKARRHFILPWGGGSQDSVLMLRRILATVLIAAAAGAAEPAAPAGPAPHPGTDRIALAANLYLRPIDGRDAYVVVHACPWPANSLLVVMPDGTLVLAGTPYTADATRAVLAWARGRFGGHRIVGIDTGYHVDNLGGNQALLDAGAAVYGSDLTIQLLRERGERMRQVTLAMIGDPESPAYRLHAGLKFVPPDHPFPLRDGLRLTFGGEDIEVFYPGPSQAPDKVVVYFPARRILFGSCMILAGPRPGNTADADLAQWPEAVRRLRRFSADIVVPGHGDRLDPGLIQHTLDALAAR